MERSDALTACEWDIMWHVCLILQGPATPCPQPHVSLSLAGSEHVNIQQDVGSFLEPLNEIKLNKYTLNISHCVKANHRQNMTLNNPWPLFLPTSKHRRITRHITHSWPNPRVKGQLSGCQCQIDTRGCCVGCCERHYYHCCCWCCLGLGTRPEEGRWPTDPGPAPGSWWWESTATSPWDCCWPRRRRRT